MLASFVKKRLIVFYLKTHRDIQLKHTGIPSSQKSDAKHRQIF
jgi:hypothetical protein